MTSGPVEVGRLRAYLGHMSETAIQTPVTLAPSAAARVAAIAAKQDRKSVV